MESCTGGLMYSHELQTCDWPRNVYCTALNASSSPAIFKGNQIDSVAPTTSARGNNAAPTASAYNVPAAPSSRSPYAYSPITVDSATQIKELSRDFRNNNNNNNQGSESDNYRLGRSYQGNLPDYKNTPVNVKDSQDIHRAR